MYGGIRAAMWWPYSTLATAIWWICGSCNNCEGAIWPLYGRLQISLQSPYVFMPPPLGVGGIMFSGCPSVRPKPEIPSFDLYMGPLIHPTNRNRFTACPSVCPSVRPERFPGICRRMHGGISLKFYMLMYLEHLQNWLVYGHGLLIISPVPKDRGMLWFYVKAARRPQWC